MVERFLPREDYCLMYEDESWFSRFQMPRLRSFSPLGEPLRMTVYAAPAREPEKALALYGAVRLRDKRIAVQWSDAQPATQPTWRFLRELAAQESTKRWLIVIWDNATFHRSRELMGEIRQHNRRAAKDGGPRIAPYRLPVGAPWLNPIEPHWLHCKRAVYSVGCPLTPDEMRARVEDYFETRNTTILPGS